MSRLNDDLPPEVRDKEDEIADGLIDEMEALEEVADERDRARPSGQTPQSEADKAEPAPETL